MDRRWTNKDMEFVNLKLRSSVVNYFKVTPPMLPIAYYLANSMAIIFDFLSSWRRLRACINYLEIPMRLSRNRIGVGVVEKKYLRFLYDFVSPIPNLYRDRKFVPVFLTWLIKCLFIFFSFNSVWLYIFLLFFLRNVFLSASGKA